MSKGHNPNPCSKSGAKAMLTVEDLIDNECDFADSPCASRDCSDIATEQISFNGGKKLQLCQECSDMVQESFSRLGIATGRL